MDSERIFLNLIMVALDYISINKILLTGVMSQNATNYIDAKKCIDIANTKTVKANQRFESIVKEIQKKYTIDKEDL